ncbi:MAG: translocation/assembly module TamB [Rhodobacteraceae bacterium]|nr:translocation/assembly module TamB [Paracoccaceae bacterium]
MPVTQAHSADEEEEAGGLLVGFLEDTLSDENRQIKVTGLEGTFSSRATIQRLTVSDDEGVWLTVEGAELDWNRLALLRGRFSVNALAAERIDVARSPNPVAAPTTDLPSPEAKPFELPELPVAIELGEIRVDTITLGETIIGEPASLTLQGALQLVEGTLNTDLDVRRLDRPGDGLRLDADFANETRIINLDLDLREGPGGLVATAAALPGKPDIMLTAQGNGPLEDFTADITLATAGEERLAGSVELLAIPNEDETAAKSIGFAADLGGDIRALLQPDFHDFFGSDTRLQANGQSDPDGALELENFSLQSAALDLTGSLQMAPGGVLSAAQVDGRVFPAPGQASVLLPVSGASTRIAGADLQLTTQAGEVLDFTLSTTVRGLATPDTSVNQARIGATGALDQSDGLSVEAKIDAALAGLFLADKKLSQAVGTDLTLTTRLFTEEGALKLNGLRLTGTEYAANGDFALKGLESGMEFETDMSLVAADLGRFSGLAGQDLGGRVTASIVASGAPLSGVYEVDLEVLGQDLSAGIAEVDSMLAGSTTLDFKGGRGFEGLRIDNFELLAAGFNATAKGNLTSDAGQLTLDAKLNDLGQFVPQSEGPLVLDADVTRDGRVFSGDLKVDGPNSSSAKMNGSVDMDGRADLNFDAVLAELQRFLPEISGELTARGSAQRDNGVWTIDTKAQGPSGIEANVAGNFDEASGEVDATAKGQVRLDAANLFMAPNSIKGAAQFDIAIKGPPSLDAISGTISTAGTSLAIPAARQSIRDINATISLAQSRANIQVTGAPRDGGSFQVSGPVGLLPPFESGLNVVLNGYVLTDNLSFSTEASGQISHRGSLTGGSSVAGTIVFSETEINLATIGGSVSAAPIPPMRHISEPSPSFVTRKRAGLVETEKSGSGPKIDLDIRLSAPNRVFARGRGLQAELGGEILVRGSADKISPSGQVELIRGTFDFLGRRLELTKGILTLQGDLSPYIEFESTTDTSEGTATLEIVGPLSGPQIVATSNPERPTEEVLALLIFGNQIEDLSPIALAQLAASVAELSGRGPSAGGKVREEVGADTLDVGLDSGGGARLGAGAYLSENLYTDFSVNTRGETELKLNLDVTDNFTVKGTVEGDGDTKLGVFFQRDY